MSLFLRFDWRTRFQMAQTWFRYRLEWKHRPIDHIRASWAQEGSRDSWLATKLFDLTRETVPASVDDRTWVDLEFDRLFSSVDSTLTRLGSQCLYRKLRIYRDDSAEREN